MDFNQVIIILRTTYAKNQCCVRKDGQQSEWLHAKTNVRQGCVISTILFLVFIDFVISDVTDDQPAGLVWGLTARLEDCDIVDDVTLLSYAQKIIQDKSDSTNMTARCVRHKFHPDKVKVTKVKHKSMNPPPPKKKKTNKKPHTQKKTTTTKPPQKPRVRRP